MSFGQLSNTKVIENQDVLKIPIEKKDLRNIQHQKVGQYLRLVVNGTAPNGKTALEAGKRIGSSLDKRMNIEEILTKEIEYLESLKEKIYREMEPITEELKDINNKYNIFASDMELEKTAELLADAVVNRKTLGPNLVLGMDIGLLEGRMSKAVLNTFYNFRVNPIVEESVEKAQLVAYDNHLVGYEYSDDFQLTGNEDKYNGMFDNLISLICEAINYDNGDNFTRIKMPRVGLEKIVNYITQGYIKLPDCYNDKNKCVNVESWIIGTFNSELKKYGINLRAIDTLDDGLKVYRIQS